MADMAEQPSLMPFFDELHFAANEPIAAAA
jgi:hypothetical protein